MKVVNEYPLRRLTEGFTAPTFRRAIALSSRGTTLALKGRMQPEERNAHRACLIAILALAVTATACGTSSPPPAPDADPTGGRLSAFATSVGRDVAAASDAVMSKLGFDSGAGAAKTEEATTNAARPATPHATRRRARRATRLERPAATATDVVPPPAPIPAVPPIGITEAAAAPAIHEPVASDDSIFTVADLGVTRPNLRESQVPCRSGLAMCLASADTLEDSSISRSKPMASDAATDSLYMDDRAISQQGDVERIRFLSAPEDGGRTG